MSIYTLACFSASGPYFYQLVKPELANSLREYSEKLLQRRAECGKQESGEYCGPVSTSYSEATCRVWLRKRC
jgi:hypothetical protein